MKWLADAPSNIALIKYMGRKNDESKIPANSSLSYTLPHLKSFVELELLPQGISQWEPLALNDANPINLSEAAQQRFLNHLNKILRIFFEDTPLPAFIARSANNFPLGVGLASSASSFAALTVAAARAASALTQKPELPLENIMALSREGSGSSCRSFYDGWVLWENERVKKMHYPAYTDLIHQVILLETKEKEVPSSQAHQRVKTSPFYEKRHERATDHLNHFMKALENENWARLYQIAWDEFNDMHQLFETAVPAFSYHNQNSRILLNKLRAYWDKKGDGPLITMDAGPNIHLLYRSNQQDIQQDIQHQLLSGYSYVLSA
jgi:diphosphomevalonate decarboxylase